MHRTVLVNCCLTMYFFLLAGACTSTVKAPVDTRSQANTESRAGYSSPSSGKYPEQAGDYHIVEKGDTLYSIAWRYGLDYKKVAQWNEISGSYTIYPGQFIRLKASTKKAQALTAGPVKSRGNAQKPESKPRKQARSPAKKPVVASKSSRSKPLAWRWPTRGKLVKFNTPTSKKGIDIAGKAGQKIHAAADGDVVYSGSGLLGYGKLIIIKHSETYLSAYAHNEKIYAKEGDAVKAGQQIATMGLGNKGRPVLHFEIRKDGTPVNPLSHLPKSS